MKKAFSDLHQGVFEIGVEGDGEVGRQRPRRGRPDQRRDRFIARPDPDAFSRLPPSCERDGHRRARVVVVFDFRLGEGRSALGTPVDRFEAPLDIAGKHETVQGRGDLGLVEVVHRQIGIVPLAEDAEAHELVPLDLVVTISILAAGRPNFGDAHLAFLRTEFLVDLVFDRQAVAVPPGNVGAVKAEHRPRLDDDVLEDLVERGSHVDRTIGVGGAVVEDEAL